MTKEIHLEISTPKKQRTYDLVIDRDATGGSLVGSRFSAFGYVVCDVSIDCAENCYGVESQPSITLRLEPLNHKSMTKCEPRAEPMRPKKRRIAQIG